MSFICHEKCKHQHGEHDEMSACDRRCGCLYYMDRQLDTAHKMLRFVANELMCIRYAWSFDDGRHRRVVQIVEDIRKIGGL